MLQSVGSVTHSRGVPTPNLDLNKEPVRPVPSDCQPLRPTPSSSVANDENNDENRQRVVLWKEGSRTHQRIVEGVGSICIGHLCSTQCDVGEVTQISLRNEVSARANMQVAPNCA